MTNEEKAQEMSERALVYLPCGSTFPFYLTALGMAKWKDQLLKEYLEKKEQELIFSDKILDGVKLEFLHEIFNELFKEEKK